MQKGLEEGDLGKDLSTAALLPPRKGKPAMRRFGGLMLGGLLVSAAIYSLCETCPGRKLTEEGGRGASKLSQEVN